MFADERNGLLQQMRDVLNDYISVIDSWIDRETGQLLQPHETSYRENYAPATAAFILAGVFRRSNDQGTRESALLMLKRSVELLKNPQIDPFCRVFIHHYGLMALLQLPEELRCEFAGDFVHYIPEDCGTVNLNCAALQLGMELFLEELGFRRAREEYMNRLIELIEDRQSDGFLNDSFRSGAADMAEGDGMPTAYTIFSLFILTSVLAMVENWSPAYTGLRERIERIVEEGQEWVNHAASLDGTFAMMERSRHQMFTWGSSVALYAYAGMGDVGLFSKVFEHWLPFKHADGTYSVTPNYLPHELRVGYEWYSHVNCYDNLAMCGITVAERIITRGLLSQKAGSRKPLPVNQQYADPRSGYAFVRQGGSFFAGSLRMHDGKYAPALAGFHFRLNNRPLPLAEPRLNGERLHGVLYHQAYDLGAWEGYLLRDEAGKCHFPGFTKNADYGWIEQGIELEAEDEALSCVKSIRIVEQGFEWTYEIRAKQRFVSCEHILPFLVTDGKHSLQLGKKTRRALQFAFAGQSYLLSYEILSDSRLELKPSLHTGEIDLSLERSLFSVSGVAANLSLKIAAPVKPQECIKWRTRIVAITN